MDSMNKNRKKGCFLYNLMLYSLTGLACSLIICCYLHWFCSFSKFSMKQFLFMYVPYIWPSFCSPKCLFIVANVIIVFLVGESNLMGSSGNSSTSPAADLYDGYVQSSRLRARGGASNFPEKIEEKKPHVHDHQMKVIEQCVKRVHQGQNVIKEKDEEEEGGLPTEELNKRVEEFIARVNKQRWVEERSLICCEN